MGLKIRHSDGTLQDLTDAEEAAINKRLDKVLSPDFGKGFVKEQSDKFSEFMRLSDLLELDRAKKTLSQEVRESISERFYVLADEMREDCNAHMRERAARPHHHGVSSMNVEGNEEQVVEFAVLLEVVGPLSVKERGQQIGDYDSFDDCLYAVAVDNPVAPLDAGFELLHGSSVTKIDDTHYRLDIKANVFDTDKLKQAATTSHQTRWQCSIDAFYSSNTPPTATDLLFELITSNGMGANREFYGYFVVRRL
jgi:hypothetical protein